MEGSRATIGDHSALEGWWNSETPETVKDKKGAIDLLPPTEIFSGDFGRGEAEWPGHSSKEQGH